MTDERGLTRREVLAALAAGGAAALGVGALLRARDGSSDDDLPAEAAGALKALGTAVRAAHPDLLDDPAAVADLDVDDVGADPLGALTAARPRIEADYAEGAVLDVQGWVLSRTECVIAAIAAPA